MAKKPRISKTGLSVKEKDYIYNNRDKYTIEELAQRLKKEILLVKLHIQSLDSNNFIKDSEEKLEYTQLDLRKRSEWKMFQEQFTPEELVYIEELYYRYIQQFKGDVLTTEEQQIFQILEITVFSNRIKRQMMVDEEDKIRINRDLESELNKGQTANQVLIQSLHNRLNTINAARNTKLSEYDELIKQHGKLLDQLKATRNQRIKSIEDSSKSFVGLIKSLDDPAIREQIGIDIEALRISTARAIFQLKQPHKYINGEIDFPLQTGQDNDISPSLPLPQLNNDDEDEAESEDE